MDELSSMRIFVHVVQGGSFSEASRRLNMSTAAISRQIAAIEEKLGIALIQRTSRRHRLTEAGELWFQSATKIISDIDAAKHLVSSFQQVPKGVLNLHVRRSVGESIIGPVLAQFLKDFPEIRIALSLTDTQADLLREGVDVAIWIGDLPNSTMVARRLDIPVRAAVCASPAYLAQFGEPAAPDDLVSHNCLTFNYGDGRSLWRFRSSDATSILEVTGSLESNSASILLDAAVRGIGIVLLAEWTVNSALQAGTLKRILTNHDATAWQFDPPMYVVLPPAKRLAPKARVFIDYLVHFFKTQHPSQSAAK